SALRALERTSLPKHTARSAASARPLHDALPICFRNVRELVGTFRSLALGGDAEWSEAQGAFSDPVPRPPAATTSVPVTRAEEPAPPRVRPDLWMGLTAVGVALAGIGGALWFVEGGMAPANAPGASAPASLEAAPAAPATDQPKVERAAEVPSPAVVPELTGVE